MPYFTGLARVAKRTGYPVVEVDGWKERGHGPMAACETIVAHHTATPRTAKGNYPSLSTVRDGRAGLKGPLAHYGLGRDGTIYVIAAGVCYHAGATWEARQGNARAIGIEAENDGVGEPWSDAQLDSYARLCKALCEEFKLPVERVQGHKEIAKPKGRKVDPNFDMAAFRKRVAAVKLDEKPNPPKSAPATKPATKPAAKPSLKKGWPHEPLAPVSKHNDASHAAWRKLLTDVGHLREGERLTFGFQRWLASLGEDVGPADGHFGPRTTKALQSFLKKKGHYTGRIDGIRGPMTVRAEIAYLNAQREFYG